MAVLSQYQVFRETFKNDESVALNGGTVTPVSSYPVISSGATFNSTLGYIEYTKPTWLGATDSSFVIFLDYKHPADTEDVILWSIGDADNGITIKIGTAAAADADGEIEVVIAEDGTVNTQTFDTTDIVDLKDNNRHTIAVFFV